MDRKKILIIDDEKDFVNLVKKNLEIMGNFEVHVALNGKEGIRIARKLSPDIIVLDVLMPVMDGLAVLERLKKDDSTMGIPVIMLSAKDDDASKIRAAHLYDEFYLTKPIDANDLKAKIEEVLKRVGG